MAKEDKKKNRRNSLGKGLSALLSDDDSRDLKGKELRPSGPVAEIPVDSIESNPYQPRTEFDEEALNELSRSIKNQGLIQPITVRSLGGGDYQLIAGERRLKASKLAGKETIAAYVRTANDEQMLEMALIENIQRENLNPVETALGYERLVNELNLTLEELADRVGKKRATVNNYMRLLRLPPEIQLGLRDSKLSMGHARALLGLEKTEEQLELYKQIQQKNLSVRDVEKRVRSGSTSKKNEKSAAGKKSPFIRKVEENLENKFGNRVLISQQKSGKGDLKITFDSTEDLNRILEIIDL